MAQGNGQTGAQLQKVQGALMHSTHAPNPEAEAAPGGDQSLPVGAVRVEEGRFTHPDGTVDSGLTDANTGEVIRPVRRAWKLYQFRDVDPGEVENYRARNDLAVWKIGDQTIQRKWYLVSQHDTEQDALAAAAKL